jgi:hypothetical protein
VEVEVVIRSQAKWADDRAYLLRTLALEEKKVKIEVDKVALEREKLALERRRLEFDMAQVNR